MSEAWSETDRVAMARALELAGKGLNTTDPNPRVGCVLVRDGRIIAEGWHERPGGPHAEPAALAAAGPAARGATAYVTLEPCSHFGRTPPCADALIAAGVAEVVYALDDPNPEVSGRGAARLREHGIRVRSGLMADRSIAINPGYFKRRREGLPFVRVKVAASLDGRTALENGESRWITSEAARTDVQHARARSSVVLTGIGTVLADDPALDVRLPGCTRQPLRVVLDSQLRTPPTARVLGREGRVLVYGVPDHPDRRRALERAGAEVAIVPAHGARPDLPAVLRLLAARGANEVWVEAGAELAGAFLREGLFDELVLYLAPTLLGPGRPLAALPPLAALAARPRLRFANVRQVGEDLCLTLVKGN
nr:MAG: bifunctional diaminohydroxyphosphoribosylaminopyrimidine deaminase/5-amino-6-(5-phosphoribosylamino)uracil reductase RibD [Pseudomonadota bacterium]